jgi:hypothetical protein
LRRKKFIFSIIVMHFRKYVCLGQFRLG